MRNHGVVALFRCVIRGNRSDGTQSASTGGGVSAEINSLLVLNTCEVSGNSAYRAGGAFVAANAELRVYDTLVTGNEGRSVTGGIGSYGALELQNATVSGNAASAGCGGVQAMAGSVTINASTIVRNVVAAGGVGTGNLLSNVPVSIVGSIVAESNRLNCAGSGPFTSGGGNLEDADICGFGLASDLPNTNPLIGDLRYNGGFAMTHALRAGSPAIDAASFAHCPTYDARGVVRPQGAGCDSGAYEWQRRGLVPVIPLLD